VEIKTFRQTENSDSSFEENHGHNQTAQSLSWLSEHGLLGASRARLRREKKIVKNILLIFYGK
jgi:hypothetical protein